MEVAKQSLKTIVKPLFNSIGECDKRIEPKGTCPFLQDKHFCTLFNECVDYSMVHDQTKGLLKCRNLKKNLVDFAERLNVQKETDNG